MENPLCSCLQAESLFNPVMAVLKAAGNTADGASPKTVIIMADYELDLLPFEAFSVFESCASVSRDISLALVSMRIAEPLDLQLNDCAYLLEPSINLDQGKQ